VDRANLSDLTPFVTADGSSIRELAHPSWTTARGQSLAEASVEAGDCVVVPPGTPHKLWNTGSTLLVLLCCFAPAYSDDDTVMTGR
jgi:uncharacterized RmlC-like cupin family protein